MALEWEWKKIFTVLGVLSLCFLIIPIPIERNGMKEHEHEFKIFMKKFNKSYDTNSTEYILRLSNFQESIKKIKDLNGERTSSASALFGVTSFSDLSEEEFLRDHLQPTLDAHVKKSHHGRHRDHNHHHHIKRQVPKNVPLKVDWRNKNVITSVKNQKLCGACWAFSTVEVMESMQAISHGKLESLSVQEAIDCAGYGNLGCEGGDMCSLLDWMVTNNVGLQLESQYPLHLKTETCHLNKNVTGVHVASNFTCENLVDDENHLLTLLAFHGPVAVAVNAVAWQYYLGGIIHFHCSGAVINHAVQLVGYDLTAPVPYYIARNSWGPEFGISGYLYLAIGSNICGVATEVVSLDIL
ncbi:hypothetical protein R5R35_012229 [Gryllus longicercus]|uniref:Cathepsin O n=1 Tax=Gryllus longicercus TaxID=2509291 RepID=A0AAN9VE63_9ORTH